jgi:Zn-dependent protease with chaperone function
MICLAQYFDGFSSASIAVELTVESGQLRIEGLGVNKVWAISSLEISEKLGNTPRIIRHPNEGLCEVTDLSALANLLEKSGRRVSVPSRIVESLHHSMRGALLSMLLMLGFFGLSYQYGLPVLAKAIAMSLPEASIKVLDAGTLDSLDRLFLSPSQLPIARQQSIARGFSQLVNDQHAPKYHLVFRRSPEIGPNAFALPSGTIVLLDELVNLSDNDTQLFGVLAHELGHVEKRHGVRTLLQTSIVGLAMTWWLGDISTLLASAPAALIGAKYSRDMEREADDYGKGLLVNQGLSACEMGRLLEKMEAQIAKLSAKPKSSNKTNDAQKNTEQANQVLDYLSSHPATPERMHVLCEK